MRRDAKPKKANAEAQLPVHRKALKNENARVRDLEMRLRQVGQGSTFTFTLPGRPADGGGGDQGGGIPH
jgi:hypothetical protein